MVAAITAHVMAGAVADVGIRETARIASVSDGRINAMQPKLLAQAEERPLTLDEVRQWLQMRDLLEYLRRQKAERRNGMPEAAAIVDDEIAALDLDLAGFRQNGLPAFVVPWMADEEDDQ